MSIKNLIAALGGDRKVADHVNLRPSAIRNWIRDGYVPPRHHAEIVALADEHGLYVTTEELDPGGAKHA